MQVTEIWSAPLARNFDNHPTVQAIRGRSSGHAPVPPSPRTLDADELRAVCLEAGADDVGFVAIGRSELNDQRADILAFAPGTRTLISIACRMAEPAVRASARSVANLEFHETTDHVNHVARLIGAKLALRGVRALHPPAGFPMEMATFPGKVWLVSHKPVAVAAGLGQMGLHRNVIHPRFGSFILLGTILIDAEVSRASTPVDYNPCVECKLCIAACPVGAIADDGFNFASCYTHNYREFMGGFTDWVERVADSGSARAYRADVTDAETVSMWQSLAFGPSYKAAYCLAVCPAGEDVMSPFLSDKPGFIRDVVRPLQQKRESIYVSPGSDAEAHVAKRYPHKTIRHARGVLRPTSIAGFIAGMQHVFQPGQSKGVSAVYHFTFTGNEQAQCTVTIANQRIEVRDGHVGEPSLRVAADARAWLRMLRGDRSIVWELLARRIRLKGDPRLLIRFGKCFPK